MFRGADFKEPSAGTCGRKCGAESPLCFYLLALSVYDQFRVTLEINVFITTPTSMPSASAHHPPPAESPFSHGYRARLRRRRKKKDPTNNFRNVGKLQSAKRIGAGKKLFSCPSQGV